ncbi:hypothetical protein GJ496_006554 [Pomphorhynchus laevis]|nr:hypothetical protein GJ496_006554 [Pomphorhynchus laevis]
MSNFSINENVSKREDLLSSEHAICVSTLRSLSEQMTNDDENVLPEQLRRHGLVTCAEMRRINREMQRITQEKRDATLLKRNQVEKSFLIMHNLLYEKARIQEEISRCLGMESADKNIDLVSLEEFYEHAPKEISQEDTTKDNEHIQRIARLKWELKQRQELHLKVIELKTHNKQISDQIMTEKRRADGIWPKFNSVVKACQPIKDYLVDVVPQDKISLVDLKHFALLLTDQLYSIYAMSVAYMEESDNHTLLCSVHNINEDQRIDNEKLDIEYVRRIHPYSVLLTIKHEYNIELHIEFFHVIDSKVVCAKLIDNEALQEQIGQGNLMELFEIEGSSEIMIPDIEISKELSNQIGKPYVWAQHLIQQTNSSDRKTTFSDIIQTMNVMIKRRIDLNQVTAKLSDCHCSEYVGNYTWPKISTNCKIESCCMLSKQDLQQDCNFSCEEIRRLGNYPIFKCKIRRDKTCLLAYISMPPAFRSQAPYCLLQIQKKDGSILKRNFCSDIKNLEYAIRIQSIKALAKSLDINGLLCGTLKCIMIGFDSLLTNKAEFGNSSQRQWFSGVIVSTVRGRWRDLPFFINEQFGVLEHHPQLK